MAQIPGAVMQGIKRYAWLIFLIALTVFAGLAATMPPASLSPVRTQRLEVVNAEGAVVFRVYATDAGGRLELLNAAGNLIFSAGIAKDDETSVGLWERARQDITRQRRDLERLQLDVRAVARQVQNAERQIQQLGSVDRIETGVARQRSDLDRQRRDLERLEREIDRLSRQVDFLERRR